MMRLHRVSFMNRQKSIYVISYVRGKPPLSYFLLSREINHAVLSTRSFHTAVFASLFREVFANYIRILYDFVDIGVQGRNMTVSSSRAIDVTASFGCIFDHIDGKKIKRERKKYKYKVLFTLDVSSQRRNLPY